MSSVPDAAPAEPLADWGFRVDVVSILNWAVAELSELHLAQLWTAIWLILPVVICLSQRLSHACLSISFYTAKLRMAH